MFSKVDRERRNDMKKMLILMLSASLLIGLVGCKGKKDTQEQESTLTSAESSAVPVKESSEPKKETSKAEASKQEASKAEASKEASKDVSKTDSSAADTSETESSKTESSETETSVEESTESEVSEESIEESLVLESSAVSETSEEESEAEESSEDSQTEESIPAPKPPVALSGDTVDAAWFDDAVFVGDSVTLKLSYYADNGSLGNATFLCAGSLGYNNAQMGLYEEGNVHPVLYGEKVTVVGGLSQLQPKKIFVMLGMNDIGLYGVDGAIEGMKTLTSQISQSCPDAMIYIQSVTPMLENMQLTDLNNRTIAEFDSKVQPICQQRGYIYLDIASAVEDGSGALIYDYCGDPTAMGLHFSDAGCDAWVSYLKSHVA